MNELILIVVSFFSSMLTAMAGVGGGLLLLSVMPGLLPAAAIIPVHGIAQVASNVSRVAFAPKQIDWRIFIPFVFGAAFGAATGSHFVVRFPTDYIPILLGCIILLMAWLPNSKIGFRFPGNFFTLGAVQSFVALFIGAPGPLALSVLFRKGLSRDRIVITHAALMAGLHFVKVSTFGFLGFLFRPYLVLIAGMIVSVSLGSFAGTQLRAKVPEKLFRKALRILLTVLALRMIIWAFI